jgi:hypothetical protein
LFSSERQEAVYITFGKGTAKQEKEGEKPALFPVLPKTL